MLQQTQVSRVLKKYPEFIREFPNFSALAQAPLPKVLKVWQGMGYNRRAVLMKKLAQAVVKDYKSKLPKETEKLTALPGIGKGTAGALQAFAFNLPSVFIETNIRRAFIHSFFKNKKRIEDWQILKLIEKSVDKTNPREWYWALMDYGAMLAKDPGGNVNRYSSHYKTQSAFKGSNREVRGAIIKFLLEHNATGKKDLYKKLEMMTKMRVASMQTILESLKREGFINLKRSQVYLVK